LEVNADKKLQAVDFHWIWNLRELFEKDAEGFTASLFTPGSLDPAKFKQFEAVCLNLKDNLVLEVDN